VSIFVQLDICLPRHPKFLRLCRATSMSEPEALGTLGFLWMLAAEVAEDGKLGDFDPGDLERLLRWDGEAGDLVAALVRCGWLDQHEDGSLRVHDWHHATGKGLHERALARARKRRQRAAQKDSVASERDSHADVTPSCHAAVPRKSRHKQDGDGDGDGDGEDPNSKPPAEKPSAHAPGSAPEEPKAKPRKRRAGPEAFNALLEHPYKGHERALDFFRAEFPAYDGRNGRIDLRSKLARIKAWFVAAPPSKQWTTPSGIHDWLSKDYPSVRSSWERDTKGASYGAHSSTLTLEEVLSGSA